MLSVPAAGTITAASDRVTGGSIHTVTRLSTAGSEVMPVTRHVALVAAESHATLALPGHWIADGVTSTLTVTGTVLAVAASSTGYKQQRRYDGNNIRTFYLSVINVINTLKTK